MDVFYFYSVPFNDRAHFVASSFLLSPSLFYPHTNPVRSVMLRENVVGSKCVLCDYGFELVCLPALSSVLWWLWLSVLLLLFPLVIILWAIEKEVQ